MTSSTYTRVIVGTSLVLLAGLAALGADPWGHVAVVAVALAALMAGRALAARVRTDAVDTVSNVDPAAPGDDPVGIVAARRLTAVGDAAFRHIDDLRRVIGAAGFGVVMMDRRGVVEAVFGDPAPVGTTDRVRSPEILGMVASALEQGQVASATLVAGVRGRSYRWVVVPLDADRVGAVIDDVTELERVQAMRRSFIADASHELRTPIATIRATVEALQAAVGRDEQRVRRFADALEQQTIRIGRLVADLLDLSRLESTVAEPVLFDVGPVVTAEVEALRDQATAGDVRLEADVRSIGIVGDASDVGLAVRNVVANAIAHTGRGGRVSVRAGDVEGRTVVEVVDTGVGIPAADQERIFNRFYRVDDARSRERGGTGLGLAIVRHVVNRHGGSVEVRSVLGQGSTFRLDLGPTVSLPASGAPTGRSRNAGDSPTPRPSDA